MQPKKILIFSTAYYPFVGGAEVAIKEITDRAADFQFDLVTAKMKKGLPFREKIGNITVYRLGIGHPLLDKIILLLEGWYFAKHLEKKNEYVSFWSVMVSFASLSALIKNFLSRKKIPIILTLQEGDSEEYFKFKWFGLINFSWRLALKFASQVTAISNFLAQRALKYGFKGKVKVIPNGVDIEFFQSQISSLNSAEKLMIKKEMGLEENDFVLITASRLVEKNGLAFVIEALPKLAENIKFVVLGVGELEAALKKLAIELNVSHRVKFLGFVSQEKLPKYLASSDIFIRPSLSEGFGNSFIEAFAAKLPVIGTRVGGIVDFLEDGKTGYVCAPKNSDSIVEAVKRIIDDPQKREEVVQHAYHLVEEQYDWSRISASMQNVFKESINI